MGASKMAKAADYYANVLGWQIFACLKESKIPATEHGYLDAAIDPAPWSRQPDLNIGLACAPSELIGLDFDPNKASNAACDLAKQLMAEYPTPMQLTPTDGYHLLYTLPDNVELSNSAGELPKGFDVRVNGYIVLAPSTVVYHGDDAIAKGVDDGYSGAYQWVDRHWPHELPIAPLPAHVLELLKPKRTGSPQGPDSSPNGGGSPMGPNRSAEQNRAYAEAALEDELDILARTGIGERNNQLNKSGFNLGQLIAAGWLDETEVRDKLRTVALSIGLTEAETRNTIKSGIEDGKQKPREIPPDPELNFDSGEDQGGKKRQRKWESQKALKKLHQLGYEFRWNELDDSLEVNGVRIDNGLAAQIRTQMRDRGYKRLQPVEDAYVAHAYEHRYHPIKQYLTSLQWDGHNHIAALCRYIDDKHPKITYPDGGQVAVFNVWLSRWLLGSIAKVFEAGAVRGQNPMLVLDGDQDIGKSTFCKFLASPLPELFVEDAIHPDDKEHHRYLATKWIWEVAELGATTRRQDQEAIKSFLTKHDVTFRKPYERHPIVKPALASFIGTVNDQAGFLTDKTGNRRFLAVTLTRINWKYIDDIDIHQLWAQAYHLYAKGESWQLTPSESTYRDMLNAEYEIEEPLEGWILKECEIDLDNEEWVTSTSDIVAAMQDAGVTGGTRAIQMGVANVLRSMGLPRHPSRRPRSWIGIRVKPADDTPT